MDQSVFSLGATTAIGAVAQNSPFGDGETAAIGAFIIAIYGLGCIAMIIGLVAQWKIFAKTGNHGALSLLMLVPIVGFGIVLWLAFSEWPIEQELAILKSKLKSKSGGHNEWD